MGVYVNRIYTYSICNWYNHSVKRPSIKCWSLGLNINAVCLVFSEFHVQYTQKTPAAAPSDEFARGGHYCPSERLNCPSTLFSISSFPSSIWLSKLQPTHKRGGNIEAQFMLLLVMIHVLQNCAYSD